MVFNWVRFPMQFQYRCWYYKTHKMRTKLIDAIIELSGDEFESKQDLIELAKESEDQLVDRLIAIADYYRDNN